MYCMQLLSLFSNSSLLSSKKLLNGLAIIFVVLVLNVNNGEAHNSHHQHEPPQHKNAIGAPELTEKIGGNRTIVVDLNGNGDYKSVQAAIDAVPDGNSNWITIHLRKGIFRS